MIAWAKSRRVLASLVATILLTWVAVSAAQVMITGPNLRSPGTFAHALGLFVALLSGSITAYQLNNGLSVATGNMLSGPQRFPGM